MTFEVSRDGQSLGTYSDEGIQRRLDNGDLLLTDLFFLKEQNRWAPLSELPKSEVAQVTEFTQKVALSGPPLLVTPALLAVNVLVFLAMLLGGVSLMSPVPADLVRWGADFGPLVREGQWWRLLTAAFVHVGLLHVAFNMWALFSSGAFLERLFGRARFFTIYLLAAVGGDLASIAWQPHTVAAGASGAIFGIYGGLIGFLAVRHKSIPPAAASSLGRNALAFVGYNVVFGLNPASHIDMAAHLGGLFTGFLAGCALAYGAESGNEVKRSLVVALAGLVLFVGAGFGLRRGDLTQAETFTAAMTGKTLIVGNTSQLVYSGTATEADAKQLAGRLAVLGFAKAQKATILYTKSRSGSVVSVVVKEGAWQNAGMMPIFDVWGRMISTTTGTPLKFRLLDQQLQVKKEFVYDGKGAAPVIGSPKAP